MCYIMIRQELKSYSFTRPKCTKTHISTLSLKKIRKHPPHCHCETLSFKALPLTFFSHTLTSSYAHRGGFRSRGPHTDGSDGSRQVDKEGRSVGESLSTIPVIKIETFSAHMVCSNRYLLFGVWISTDAF